MKYFCDRLCRYEAIRDGRSWAEGVGARVKVQENGRDAGII